MPATARPAVLAWSPVLLILSVLLAAPVPARGADDRVPLFPEELSACNRDQLDALLERLSLSARDGSLPPVVHSLLVTYSNRFGFYEGLAVGMPYHRSSAEPGSPGPERQLAFHLDPSVRELLLNPARPPLAQVSLTRETSTSSLVAEHDPYAVEVRLHPALAPGGPPVAGDLVIDNLEARDAGAVPSATDTKPGRGLGVSGITDLCHTELTDLDRRIFAVLQRTLRVYVPHDESGLVHDTRIAVYRGIGAADYLAQVFLVHPVTGELEPPARFSNPPRLSITVGVDDDGRLGLGSLAFLDPPAAAASGGFAAIVRPVFAGLGPPPGDGYDTVAELPWDPTAGPVDFDWKDVLAGTAWNPADPAPRECGQGTAAEIAATPRTDENLEHLALALSFPRLTARQAVYERLVRDVAAIRRAVPAVAQVPFLPRTTGRTLLLTPDGVDTYRAIGNGSYRDWSCLNDWYQVTRIDFDSLGEFLQIRVGFVGLFDLDRVAAGYAALPGIVAALPETVDYPPVLYRASLCAAVEGTTYRYFFDFPKGSPLTYYFRVSLSGRVERVGVHNHESLAPPAPWLPLRDECYAGLPPREQAR